MEQDNPYAATNVHHDQFYVQTPPIPNYLVWSILVTLFCCVPFGIVGIVYSVMADNAKQYGDFARAIECAKKAKLWLLIGFIPMVIFYAIYLVIIVVAVISGGIQ